MNNYIYIDGKKVEKEIDMEAGTKLWEHIINSLVKTYPHLKIKGE